MICALFLWMLSRFSFYLSFLAVWLWRAHVCILVIFQFCFEFTEDQDAFLKSWEISSRYSFEYCFCLVLSFPPGTPRTCILECFIFSHRSMSLFSLNFFYILLSISLLLISWVSTLSLCYLTQICFYCGFSFLTKVLKPESYFAFSLHYHPKLWILLILFYFFLYFCALLLLFLNVCVVIIFIFLAILFFSFWWVFSAIHYTMCNLLFPFNITYTIFHTLCSCLL